MTTPATRGHTLPPDAFDADIARLTAITIAARAANAGSTSPTVAPVDTTPDGSPPVWFEQLVDEARTALAAMAEGAPAPFLQALRTGDAFFGYEFGGVVRIDPTGDITILRHQGPLSSRHRWARRAAYCMPLVVFASGLLTPDGRHDIPSLVFLAAAFVFPALAIATDIRERGSTQAFDAVSIVAAFDGDVLMAANAVVHTVAAAHTQHTAHETARVQHAKATAHFANPTTRWQHTPLAAATTADASAP